MARLMLREQKRALAFIREAYRVRDFNGFVVFLLAALPKLINSEVTSYNEMRPELRESRNWVNPESLMIAKRDEARANVMHEHPVVSHYQRNGQDRVLRLSDFLSRRELRNMALYSEHYRPLGGMLDCLPILWSDGDAVNAIGVHRQAQFTEREQAMMNVVRPHLVQAHANAMLVSRLRSENALLERALEASACGVVMVKPDRSIGFTTAIARRLIEDYFDRASGPERLPEMLELWVRQHDAAVRATLDLPRPRHPLVISRENRRLTVKLIPADGELMLVLEERETVIRASSLASLGLSPRESQVLALIANGRSKTEIAPLLGVNRRTIETHLLHINQRLGVSSVVEAACAAFQASRLDKGAPDEAEREETRRYVNGKMTRNHE